jgi:hypothetical protein
MLKKITISILFLLTSIFVGYSQTVFINEIHYDNAGADANEGFEIAGPAGTDLSCYDIVLYNGASGASYATINLSGIIDDEGCNYGALWFSFAGIQNGAPDGIALYNSCTATVIQFLSYEGSFTATNGVANGVISTDIGVAESGATLTTESLQLTGTGTTYPEFGWNAPATNSQGSINPGQDFCTVCVADTEPTTNSSTLGFSNIDCASMDLAWTSGNGANRIIVASIAPIVGTPSDQTAYAASSTFGSGATTAVGEFVVFNGLGNSVTTVGLTQSTTYYFAIFEYNGVLPGCEENYFITAVLTGNTTTTACVCPEITGILVDACGGSEGINEFFTFTNGNSNLPIDSLIATFPSGGSFCNSGCGAQTWTTNPTYVSSLNTTAACPGLFVEADPIPAGGEVIVFTGAAPTFNFDFTGLCGTGPYYAVFADNTSTVGRFANYNATCSIRTLNVDFGGTCIDAASYDRCLLSSNDGDYVTYDAAGNQTYQNDGCTPTTILPIELLYFKGNPLGTNSNLVEWSTSSEINNGYFTIERSENAVNFNSIGTLNGAGNSNTQLFYQLIDDTPYSGINYYRLKQTDFDGNFSYSEIIAINNSYSDLTTFNNKNFLYIKANNKEINGSLKITDITGRIVYSKTINGNQQINTSGFKTGIYFVSFRSSDDLIIRKFKF